MTRKDTEDAIGRYATARWSSTLDLIPTLTIAQKDIGPLAMNGMGFLSIVADGVFSQGEGPAEEIADYLSHFPGTIRSVTLPFNDTTVTWRAPYTSSAARREEFTEIGVLNGYTIEDDLLMTLLRQTASPTIQQYAYLEPARFGLGQTKY